MATRSAPGGGQTPYDAITLQILWSRLVAIVDEASAALVRTSFTTLVSESNDYSIVLLDSDGNSLAQSTGGIPGFIGTMPVAVRALLSRFPASTLHPGDALITNDPWLGAGHLNDVCIVSPIFYQGRLIAFSATVAHVASIGGRGLMPDNRDIFEEGLFIPMAKLYEAGRQNAVVVEFIRHNVSVPDLVIGDIDAQVAANQVAARRLVELLSEYDLSDVRTLAHAVHSQSETATRMAIAELPKGEFSFEMPVDGFQGTYQLSLKVIVDPESRTIECDYSGTSAQVDAAYNVVFNYTYAMTAYALKCILAPEVPNNEGCFRPVAVSAPEGSLLNPRYPAAVVARSAIGHHLPTLVFAALSKAIPARVRAASSMSFWAVTLSGARDDGRPFVSTFMFNGGVGAGMDMPGRTCLTWPSNLANTPIEIVERILPIRFVQKAIADGSGGAGRWHGGAGQVVEFLVSGADLVRMELVPPRVTQRPFGLFGGEPGQVGGLYVNGVLRDPNYRQELREGDIVRLVSPGGGGYGPPTQPSEV